MNLENIDVCITFDTTGSMYPCLTQVRRTVKETVRRLFHDIPDLRIAVIAHGDYYDERWAYITKIFDFSRDVNNVVDFVGSVGRTDGGDRPECYELVLYQARTQLSWKTGRAKVIVMIGDDIPHNPDYPRNTKRIDWRNELGLLLEANINVYGVHAMPGIRRHSKPFYEEIARKTGGFYLTLDQFSYITDLIMGICYKQQSEEAFDQFAKEVYRSGRLSKGLKSSFRSMSSLGPDILTEKSIYSYHEDGLTPVPSGRFQVIYVDKELTIRNFIEDAGITFQTGRGFYELVRHGKKRYKVQQYKEIILMDRGSGDFFTGPEARQILGLKPQVEIVGKNRGVVESLPPKSVDRYRVFIQSTSYTRKLVPGSRLLYEVEDWDMAEAA